MKTRHFDIALLKFKSVLVAFASILIKMVGTRLDAWKIGKAHACHIFQKQNKYLHLVGTKVSPMVCLCWLSSLCLHQCANKNGWDKTRCLKDWEGTCLPYFQKDTSGWDKTQCLKTWGGVYLPHLQKTNRYRLANKEPMQREKILHCPDLSTQHNVVSLYLQLCVSPWRPYLRTK